MLKEYYFDRLAAFLASSIKVFLYSLSLIRFNAILAFSTALSAKSWHLLSESVLWINSSTLSKSQSLIAFSRMALSSLEQSRSAKIKGRVRVP